MNQDCCIPTDSGADSTFNIFIARECRFALLGLTEAAAIEKLANRIVAEGLSVRTVEEIIAIAKPSSKSKKSGSAKKSSPELKELGEKIGDVLDTRVRIESNGSKGEIIVEYSGAEDLQRLVKLISSARR